MSEKIDWEKRAGELCFEIFKDHEGSIWNNEGRPSWTDKALQLGREMADARAEEIAKRCEDLAMFESAELARSTVAKPEPPEYVSIGDEIRADERKKCALSDADILEKAREIYRSGDPMKINPVVASCLTLRINDIRKPKTREAVLEEALREIANGSQVGTPGLKHEEWSLEKQTRSELLAQRALNWKEGDH